MHSATPREFWLCQLLVAKSSEMLRHSNISMLPTGWTHFKSCTPAASVTLVLLPVWSQLSSISWEKPGVWWVHSVISELNPLESDESNHQPEQRARTVSGNGRGIWEGKGASAFLAVSCYISAALLQNKDPCYSCETMLCSLVLPPKAMSTSKSWHPLNLM